ncbi:uncharacterized protein LOC142608377 [Castanea sativa]|uniref:uncharacterized protein LOC142608377 n=1 Tax=Castanea sativa TaxID=21020 RepID=UPI003F64EB68
MPDPSEQWEIEEYSCEDNGGKMSWLLNNALRLGKKVLITGIVVSSTTLVIPPLLAISAIGFVVSIPSGLLLASYACSERLMTKLLPGPALPSHLLDFGLASDDEEVEEEHEGCEGDIGIEKEEEEKMEKTKRGIEMRIELGLREGEVTKGNNFGVKKDEQGLIEDVDDILEENGYDEDGGECLDEEEETPLEKMIKAKHLGPREDEKEEPVIEENDEQLVDGAEKGLVVVIEDVGDCMGGKEETPLEEMIEVKPLGLREDEKEEPVIEEKRNEQPVDEGTKGVLVVIEEYEESGNSIEGLETPFEVTTVVVLEEIGSNERVNDIEEEELVRETRGLIETLRDECKANDAVKEDKQYLEERQGGTEEGEQKIVKNAEVMQIPNEGKNVHSMVEMDGNLEELREEEVPKVGEKMLETRYMEIIDAVPKEAQANEKKGEGKTVNNEQAEKPIVEISETINVLIGPMGMTLVEEMREEEDFDYIKEEDVSMGDGNVEQKFVLDKGATLQGGGIEDNYLAGDANRDLQLNNEKEIVISSNADVREIPDESGLDMLDEKNEAGKQYAYVVHGTPKESLSYTGSEDIKSLEHQDPAAVDESSHKGISSEKDITVPSNEVSA